MGRPVSSSGERRKDQRLLIFYDTEVRYKLYPGFPPTRAPAIWSVQELDALLGSNGEEKFNTFLGISDQFLTASSAREINVSAATRGRVEAFRSRWGPKRIAC